MSLIITDEPSEEGPSLDIGVVEIDDLAVAIKLIDRSCEGSRPRSWEGDSFYPLDGYQRFTDLEVYPT